MSPGKVLSVVPVLFVCAAVAAGETPVVRGEYASYTGLNGSFWDGSDVRLLDDLSQARLVWISADKGIGFGKTTTGGAGFFPDEIGPSGQGSLIVAGGLVIAAYYTPGGDVVAATDYRRPIPANAAARHRFRIAADDVVWAIDAATGATRWKQVFAGKGMNHPFGKRPTYGVTPVAADGKVFMLGTTGRLYCLELATGKPLWESDIGPQHQRLEAAKKENLQKRAVLSPTTLLSSLSVVDGVLLGFDGSGDLLAFNTADGKHLWTAKGAVSTLNVPCPVKVGASTCLFAVNAKGEMRLIRTKTGEVLWTQEIGSLHHTQPLAVDGRAFVFEAHPTATSDKDKGGPKNTGRLACFALTETGAKRVWAVPDAFKCSLGYDGGPAARVGFRKGVLYCVHECYNDDSRMSRLLAVKPEEGTILSDIDIKGFGFGQFHLWGDRVVQIGDNSHESMNLGGCGYRAIAGAPTALKVSGQPLFPRTWEKGRKGCSGYVRPIRDPFVDGFQFSRTGNGDIVCWDLRAR